MESVKTTAGSAALRTDRYVKIDSWDQFQEFMKEHDMYYMLNKAANRSRVLEYFDAHGVMPPGISLNQIQSIATRKATK